MHCSKARDIVDRAIKKHEIKNTEESLPMWEELSKCPVCGGRIGGIPSHVGGTLGVCIDGRTACGYNDVSF